MRKTDSLKELLEELSLVYNEGDRMEVELTNETETVDDKKVTISTNMEEYLGKELEKPEELMAIVDSLSYEVEHIREGENYSKKHEFAKQKNLPQAAVTITKIIENCYIDHSRLSRFPGLRVARSFVVDSMMENNQKRPKIDELERNNALLEGLAQISYAGYAKGIEQADEEVRSFLSTIRPLLKKARKERNPKNRLKIISDVYDLFEKHSKIVDEDNLLNEWENPLDHDIPSIDQEQTQNQKNGENNKDNQQQTDPEQLDQEDIDWNDKGDGTPPKGDIPDNPGEADIEKELSEQDFEFEEDLETEAQKGAGNNSEGVEAEMPDLEDPLGSKGLEGELLEGELSEMEEMNEQGSKEWYGVEEEEQIDREFFEGRYEQIERKEKEKKQNIERRKKRRDERSESTHFGKEKIKDEMEKRGLDKEIEEAFREFKTRDIDVQAREGKKLNLDATVRHLSGDYGEDKLYLKRQRAEIGDRAIGIALDLSGSMNELEAKIGITSIVKATEVIGDKIVASGFKKISAPTTPTIVTNGIITPLITAPGENFNWDILDNIKTSGKTPTAHGINDVRELIDKEPAREKTMIVVTDGKANIGLESKGPIEDARKEAKKTRQKGIKVIGLGVSEVDNTYMKKIFGKKGYIRSDMDDLAKNLIEVYKRQLEVA